jgi:hypothetical protein
MFSNLKKRKRLKDLIYLEFVKALDSGDWKRSTQLSERYLKVSKKQKV